MTYQPKSYRKFLATSVAAAMVATVAAPMVLAEETTAFTDTEGVSSWAGASIDYLVAKEAIEGMGDNKFAPAVDLTRAQAATILARTLDLTVDMDAETDFEDTANHWSSPYVKAIQNQLPGVIDGYTDGTFKPEGTISRQEMAKMTVKAYDLKLDANADVSFNDNTGWGKDDIQVLASLGIVNGYDGDLFKPNGKVTRAESVVFVHRAEVPGVRVDVEYNTPVVLSVSAINAKQIVINFSSAVDKATVLDTNNVIKNMSFSSVAGAAAPGTLTGELSADGKTLTVSAAAIFDGDYAFKATTAVKSSTGVALPEYTSLVKVDDTVAPALLSTTATARTTTNSVTLAFSEPVQAAGVIVYVNSSSATVTPGAKSNELVVTTGTALAAGSTNQLSILNVKDFNGNFITPNPIVSSFTVVADSVAPTVTSVNVVGENKVEVNYSKDMNQTTFLNNARILDANGVSVTLLNASVDGKKVTLTTASTLTFGPNGTFTGNLLLGTDIADTLGNKTGSTYSQSVTFTKDTVAPSVASVAFATGNLTVTFNENVAAVPANLAGTTVINNNTGVVTDLSAIVFGATPATDASIVDNKLVIPTTLAAGDYSLRLPSSLVADLSVSANENAAAVVAFNISATAPGTDSAKPVFTYVGATTELDVAIAGTNLTTEQTISYTVQDASGLDISTVRNVNNYTLDGKALPAGTYITTNYTGTDATALTVKIHVASNAITESKATYKLVASNIKDKAGNTAVPQVSEDFALVEGVKPLFSTATISAGDATTLVLGFSEDVTAVDVTDFDFTVNSVDVSSSATLAAITAGTDKGKYYVTFATVSDGTKLYFDMNKDGFVDAADVEVATTADAAGNLNLNKSYVTSAKVAIDSASNIVDGDNNIVVVGTEIVAK